MPAAVTVLLLRHALHARLPGILWGRTPGVHLGAEGRAQAEALALALEGHAIAALYTSPQERCRETAAALATGLACPTRVDPALDEIDYGAWTGRAVSDLEGDPEWTHWNTSRSTAAPPSGEAMHAVQARARAGLTEWVAAHAGETLAVVTHQDVVKAVVCDVLGLPLERVHAFDVDPASVTTLVLWSGGGKLVGLNATPARQGGR